MKLRYKESETIELKKSFDNEAIETLCAFANSRGGKLFIGVNDKGIIEGITIGGETLQNWINEIKTKTNPFLVPDYEEKQEQGKKYVIFSIKEYPIKPVSFKGRYYKRLKNSNHAMPTSEVVNLHLKTFNTSWDYYLDNDHALKNISLNKVKRFVSSANQNNFRKIKGDPFAILKKFELLREGRISKACFLLFMKAESLFSTIELGRFQSPIIIKDGITIKTDLISEVDLVMDFIKKHLNKEYVITGKARREEKWTYPLEALREIVLNMIVHRDYAHASDSIIKIFDGKIEFYNPGRLLPGLTIKKLLSGDYSSGIRNKQIAEIFKEAGLIEKYGSGIGRIMKMFKRHGLRKPSFKEYQDGFMVIVYSKEYKTGVGEKVGERVGEKVGEKVTDNQKNILSQMKINGRITIVELSKKLHIATKNVELNIAKLKKKNMIKRIGPARSGHWKIVGF